MQYIVVANPRGVHADDDICRVGCWLGNVPRYQIVGAAERFEDDRFQV
jgi:hypothetical protein